MGSQQRAAAGAGQGRAHVVQAAALVQVALRAALGVGVLHAELVAGVEHVARLELGIFHQRLEGLLDAGEGAVAHLGYELHAVRAHR